MSYHANVEIFTVFLYDEGSKLVSAITLEVYPSEVNKHNRDFDDDPVWFIEEKGRTTLSTLQNKLREKMAQQVVHNKHGSVKEGRGTVTAFHHAKVQWGAMNATDGLSSPKASGPDLFLLADKPLLAQLRIMDKRAADWIAVKADVGVGEADLIVKTKGTGRSRH
ncbi:hypothetical protein Micbo1qcDRAFT_212629 [Microdochium bolleyi]|uniref:Uncharacterized protein n=1 Tax=Microdochium bolleyi TaxID=196109 RepID=A0A136IX43_9PEZI|nr:hypothetical protein Micbo1qcDRAFT_212629 [Microdochium bolleyi]